MFTMTEILLVGELLRGKDVLVGVEPTVGSVVLSIGGSILGSIGGTSVPRSIGETSIYPPSVGETSA